MPAKIKELFDPAQDIYRTIEKVITYNANQSDRLKAEISEYVVTESMEDQFESLMGSMQRAMDEGGANEIGVWVSGFYGSGKSSFTKYLGYALDESVKVDGEPFLKLLQSRFSRQTTKSQLAALAKRCPLAVVMVDLASDMLAGNTMEEVSTVLFYKVLKWAGYSNNLKVAALERKLQADGKFDAFVARVKSEFELDWIGEAQNDPLVVDAVVAPLAHEFYPDLFKTDSSFTTSAQDVVTFETDRVKEMLDIVRKKSGKEGVLFVIDEVGQYVASRSNLILNLDGLAKNIKAIGNGKAWIIGTAQQTLTEDDSRAALNSAELFKLKDRFPISVHLESSDIREICHRRLLGKSKDGEKALEALFSGHGQELRNSTKLQDAKRFDSDFDGAEFAKFYPFLPAHFDILLNLLGALAKSTGGIGLRSAIKVVQDILVGENGGKNAFAESDVGRLVSTTTLYDALEKDIQRAFPSLHKSVSRVAYLHPAEPVFAEAAKTVAVLQALEGLVPATVENVAALMQPSVDTPSRLDDVQKAVSDMIADARITLGEKDGRLRFFSERLSGVEQERASLNPRTSDDRRIRSETLKELFSPLPCADIHGTFTVRSGLVFRAGNNDFPVAGEQEDVQTVVSFADDGVYDTVRNDLVQESRQPDCSRKIFLLGRLRPEMDAAVSEIFRSAEIATRHRADTDAEIKDYCAAQKDREATQKDELARLFKDALSDGSFVFRGSETAVAALAPDLLAAAKTKVAEAGRLVYDRYPEASVRVETQLPEKFVRAAMGGLRGVTTAVDPLHLVKTAGGTPSIDTSNKALESIRDFLGIHGSSEGKKLQSHFGDAPFGWSPDTVRYLVAALLAGGEIRLKSAGLTITQLGDRAIDCLRSNQAFKNVGVSLRDDDRPSSEVLARAASRLTGLLGTTVLALEDEIARSCKTGLPGFQKRFASLAERLRSLSLPGAEVADAVCGALADIVSSDGSDAPARFGADQSELFDDFSWVLTAEKALADGLAGQVAAIARHRTEIESFPGTGALSALKSDAADDFSRFAAAVADRRFPFRADEIGKIAAEIARKTAEAAAKFRDEQIQAVRNAADEVSRLQEWSDLSKPEQDGALAKIDAFEFPEAADLDGLRELRNRAFAVRDEIDAIRRNVVETGRAHAEDRRQAAAAAAAKAGAKKAERAFSVPRKLSGVGEIDSLARRLSDLREELAPYDSIEVTVKVED